MTYLQKTRTQSEMLMMHKCYLFPIVCVFGFSWLLITLQNHTIILENLIVKTPQSHFNPTKSSRDYPVIRDGDVDTTKNETVDDALPGSLMRKL